MQGKGHIGSPASSISLTALSTAAPSCKTTRSAPQTPVNVTPTGQPSSPGPRGTLSAGKPVRLALTDKTSWAYPSFLVVCDRSGAEVVVVGERRMSMPSATGGDGDGWKGDECRKSASVDSVRRRRSFNDGR